MNYKREYHGQNKNSIHNSSRCKNIGTSFDDNDYICLTDMVKGQEDGSKLIEKWLTNKNTIEFLGIWEQKNNPDFNSPEFEGIKNEAGTNRFYLSVKRWIESTKAIGIKSKAGRYGGTYAHRDIAFNFGLYISPLFNLLLIKEYQRLVEAERNSLSLSWDVKRLLSKTNYHIHTDAIKNNLVPKLEISQMKQSIIYATEADVLNLALFGCTAKQWQQANPELAKTLNVRDTASINQLIVLSNIESLNAELIKQGVSKERRLSILHRTAKEQMMVLKANHSEQNFRRLALNEKEQKLIE